MITNRRMGLKIWRIQRIKIPGITESKRKPLDHKARQRVGIITYLGDGASTGSNRAKRNSFTGLLCAFDTDDTDVVMKASIGIIMGLNPQFEVSDAAKVVKQTVVSMASVSQPYYKDGIGYVLGQGDDGDFQLVLSLEE